LRTADAGLLHMRWSVYLLRILIHKICAGLIDAVKSDAREC